MTTRHGVQTPRFLELLFSARIKREYVLVLGEDRVEIGNIIDKIFPFGPFAVIASAEHLPFSTDGRWSQYFDLILCIGPKWVLEPEALRSYLKTWKEFLVPSGRIVVEISFHPSTPPTTMFPSDEFLDVADHTGLTITEFNGIPCKAPVQEHHRQSYIQSIQTLTRLLRDVNFGPRYSDLLRVWYVQSTDPRPQAYLPPQEVEALLTGNHTRQHAFATFQQLCRGAPRLVGLPPI
ncbi:MAG: hypothetical protein Q9180_003523 [Flavoplaca navasiana]